MCLFTNTRSRPIEADYRKDKASESADVEQETHLSDTVDYYIIRRLKVGLNRVQEDFEFEFR